MHTFHSPRTHSALQEDVGMLYERACDVARIIIARPGVALSLEDFDPDFAPPCRRAVANALAAGEDDPMDCHVSSRHVGRITEEDFERVRFAKEHICGDCPMKVECTAVSMTAPQIIVGSTLERVIPVPDSPPLTMCHYLIFGGLTPQERLITFRFMCDIVERHYRKAEESEQ